jgi:hypothetical protein
MLLRSDFQGPGDVTEHWGFAGVSRKMSKKTLARRGSEAFGLGPLDSPSNMSFRSTDSHESQVCTASAHACAKNDAAQVWCLFIGHHDEPESPQMTVQGWNDMVLSNLDMDSEALLKHKSQTIAEQITLRDLEVCFLNVYHA